MRFGYWLLQWTWGLPQNVLGLLLYLLTLRCPKRTAHGAAVTLLTGRFSRHGSLSLGMFLFLDGSEAAPRQDRVLVHEYGHSLQSLILGPLFLPLAALPSVLWAGVLHARHPERPYHSRYPENWANRLGQRRLKRPPIDW